MELQLHLLVCYVWIQLIKSTFCFSNSAIQMNVCVCMCGKQDIAEIKNRKRR